MQSPANRDLHVTPLRQIVRAVWLFCLALLVHVFFVEGFYIPTGSMAPGIAGEHRQACCKTCGNLVRVGKHSHEKETPSPGLYRKACCPWCGASIDLQNAPLHAGDLVLVNKLAFLWRQPRRWEMVLFHLWGEYIIKRILGLPGDEVLVRGGDVWINGQPARKDWDEMLSLRIVLFDQTLPGPEGWSRRWQADGGFLLGEREDVSPCAAPVLELDGAHRPASLTYQNFSYSDGKCVPLIDEQAYNGGLHSQWESVHDFSTEARVETMSGEGRICFALFNGAEQVRVSLPARGSGELRISTRRGDFATVSPETLLAQTTVAVPARPFQVGFAFVDGRVMFRLDGREVLPPVDLPVETRRMGVLRPLRLEADKAHVRLHGLRLYRDVHYTQAGTNGVGGRAVRLGPGEYFVLGDNSARSEDSRYWPDRGVVPARAIVGRPFVRIAGGRE